MQHASAAPDLEDPRTYPLLPKTESKISPSSWEAELVSKSEIVLDWAPFIIVQCLFGSQTPAVALGCGTVAAGFALVHTLLRERCCSQNVLRGGWPKTMDVGQLVVFGMLYGLAYVTESNKHDGKLIILWFNSVTTGAMALIMWMSILWGRPFVLEAMQSKMPPKLYNKLTSRQFFLAEVTEMSRFWVYILSAMTALVTIQPLLVTVCLGGDANKDASGRMANLGNFLSVGQLLLLVYGFQETYKSVARSSVLKKRVQEVKKHGLEADMLNACDFRMNFVTDEPAAHRIQSLTETADLDDAGHVLSEAFQSDKDMWIEDAALRLRFFRANLRSIACFNLVLGSFEISTGGAVVSNLRRPRCVMACIPVLSQSREEIEVFNTMEAFVEHGLEQVPYEDLIPPDDVYDLMELKKKTKHGLAKHPYIYISYFGADPTYKGRGYGRSLLRHIVGVAESRMLPLVLETTSELNRTHYERYGFEVLDRLSTKKEFVLMVRKPRRKGLDE